MNLIGDRLKVVRNRLNAKNQTEFAEWLGITQTTLSKYEKGVCDIPDDIKLGLCKFGVNLHWLLTGEGEMLSTHSAPNKEAGEPALVKEIKVLINEQTSALESRIARLEALARQQEAPPPPLYEVKGVEESGVEESEPDYEEEEMERVMYVYDIAAGLPIEQSEDLSERRAVPARHIKTNVRDYYTARIRGESMTEAGIPDGCVVLIRLSDVPRDGAIQVVRRGHRSTLKRMAEGPDGKWRLLYEDGSGRYIDMADGDWRVQGDFVAVVEGAKTEKSP